MFRPDGAAQQGKSAEDAKAPAAPDSAHKFGAVHFGEQSAAAFPFGAAASFASAKSTPTNSFGVFGQSSTPFRMPAAIPAADATTAPRVFGSAPGGTVFGAQRPADLALPRGGAFANPASEESKGASNEERLLRFERKSKGDLRLEEV